MKELKVDDKTVGVKRDRSTVMAIEVRKRKEIR
jgi:hypothetical protein